MKPYDKPALSYNEQVDLLRSRGLQVRDPGEATAFLSRVSYYRISTYFLPFQSERDRFSPGSSFDTIVELYRLDEELRKGFFGVLAQVEIALRTRFVYSLAKGWGAFAHYSPELTRSDFNHREWLDSLEREVDRAREPFIEHFRRTYEGFPRLPLWMAVEVMSLGSLSTLYDGLLPEPRRRIVEGLGLPHHVFRSWLHFLSYLRNVCAHHARLWDRELAIRPEIPRKHAIWKRLAIGNTRVFCALLVLEWITSWLGFSDVILDEVQRTLGRIQALNKYMMAAQWLSFPRSGRQHKGPGCYRAVRGATPRVELLLSSGLP
jgi:abortive infection bacteriophage resistance protein